MECVPEVGVGVGIASEGRLRVERRSQRRNRVLHPSHKQCSSVGNHTLCWVEGGGGGSNGLIFLGFGFMMRLYFVLS